MFGQAGFDVDLPKHSPSPIGLPWGVSLTGMAGMENAHKPLLNQGARTPEAPFPS